MVHTYIVSDPQRQRVKIGKTTDIEARLSQLQTGSPLRLEIILAIPFDCENALHRRFASARMIGEWFYFNFDIKRFIAEQQGRPIRAPFYTWLSTQAERTDKIGGLARFAKKHDSFPRRRRCLLSRMITFVEQNDPSRREAVKAAWREWKREGWIAHRYDVSI